MQEKFGQTVVLKDPWIWAAVLLFGLLSFAAISFTQDDAFISLRYARNLVDGHGLRYNIDENPPVEGFTNFLWIFIQAIPLFLNMEPVCYLKIVGFSTGIVLIFTCALLLLRHTQSKRWMRAGAFLAAINVPIAVWTVSGMETVWFSLCCAAALLTAPQIFNASHRIAACAFWSVLAVLTRPDGVIVVVSIVTIQFLMALSDARMRPVLIRYAAVMLSAGCLYAAWKLYYFHDLIPNTFHAKVSSGAWEELINGLYYIKDWLFRWGWPLVALSVIAALFQRRNHKAMLLLLFSSLTITYIAVVGGDFMRFHRFFTVLAVPMIVLSTGSMAVLSQRVFQKQTLIPKISFIFIAFCLLLGYSASQAAAHYRHFSRLNLKNPTQEDQKRNQILGQWLKSALPPGSKIATYNIGRIGYYSGLPTIDTLGLTDRDIARKMHADGNCGLGKEILRRAPDVLIPQNMTIQQHQPEGWRSIFYGEWKDNRSAPAIASLLNFDSRIADTLNRCPNIIRKYKEIYQKRQITIEGFKYILYVHERCAGHISSKNLLMESS